MRRLLLAALGSILLLAPGCLGPGAVDPLSPTRSVEATPPVVVAVLDSGINPYHVAFRGGPSAHAVPGLAAAARAVPLTLDEPDYASAVEADAAAWRSVAPGEIVQFPGTRIAAVSLFNHAGAAHAVLDENGHGTYVSHALVDASPHALVLMVQVDDDEHLKEAMEWVADQPWIDLVSISWATWAAEYAEGEVMMGLPEAYAKVARAGKLVFNGAGNEPIPHAAGEHSGPPYVVAVGGSQNATRGETRIAAKFPDVVAPFLQTLAAKDSTTATERVGGTSLSTPYAAGVVAEALWQVRDAIGDLGGIPREGALAVGAGRGALDDGRLTADELRAGLNLAAIHWGPADFSPSPDLNELLLSQPVLVPAAQMGWGHVDPTIAAPLAAHLLGDADLPPKPIEVVAFMEARARLRAAVWGDL